MPAEIERKFLVSEIPQHLSYKKEDKISQGYIAFEPGRNEVRVRQKGEKYFLAVKSGGGLSRNETELEITQPQFNELWATTEGQRLEKDRREYTHGELIIELDIYRGRLQGLLVAEVEFPSEEAANSFSPPDWFGQEITEDNHYRNRQLAISGLP